jgi:hypothetical protein
MMDRKNTADVIAVSFERVGTNPIYRTVSMFFHRVSLSDASERLCDILPALLITSVNEYESGVIICDGMYATMWRDDIASYREYVDEICNHHSDAVKSCCLTALLLDKILSSDTVIVTGITPCCGCVTCRRVTLPEAYIIQYSYDKNKDGAMCSKYMDVYKVSKLVLDALLSVHRRKDLVQCSSFYIVDVLNWDTPYVRDYEDMRTWLTEKSELFRLSGPKRLRACTWQEMRNMIAYRTVDKRLSQGDKS